MTGNPPAVIFQDGVNNVIVEAVAADKLFMAVTIILDLLFDMNNHCLHNLVNEY